MITLAPREDVKLREAENAWKPGAKKSEAAAGEEDEVEVLCKKIRSILNKLCPQKVRTEEINSLPITLAKLYVFITIVSQTIIPVLNNLCHLTVVTLTRNSPALGHVTLENLEMPS